MAKVMLKLLIDKKNNRVLFAEAGKDFVDFLFSIFSLPLGTVTKLLSKNRMVGCLGSLYKGIEDLSDTFIEPGENKVTVLNPKATFLFGGRAHWLTGSDYNASPVISRKLYDCGNYEECGGNVADDPRATCPSCEGQMDNELNLVASDAAVLDAGSGERGFVKKIVTYMVMDDLEVKPMSTISSITLFNKFNIQQVDALEERVVELGMDKGKALLEASLQSKTVLTKVFLEA